MVVAEAATVKMNVVHRSSSGTGSDGEAVGEVVGEIMVNMFFVFLF